MIAAQGVERERRGSNPATVTTEVFALSPRAYLRLFITRGLSWRHFVLRYGVRVLVVAALVGYFTESWRNGGHALLAVGGTAVLMLGVTVVGGWLWIRWAARRGECVRFEPVFYTLDEHSLTLHGIDKMCCTIPLIRVQRMVRTPRYCLMHVEHGLFHCVPLVAFGSEEAVRRCEHWFMAADVPVRHMAR